MGKIFLNGELYGETPLPAASDSTLGGVKVGSGLSIDGSGVLSATGVSDLNDLTDVTLTSPTNGQVLKYDSTNSVWVNGSDYPVLYDENDAEHQVGWYYTSQNTKKPIYQKKLTFSDNAGSRHWNQIGSISDVEKCLNAYGMFGAYAIGGYWGSSAGDYCALVCEVSNSNVLGISMVINGLSAGDGFVTVQYTKSTDTAVPI